MHQLTPPPLDNSRRSSRFSVLRLVVAFAVALTIACSWLAVPYLLRVQGLQFEVGQEVTVASRAYESAMWQHLVRYADSPGYAEVTAVLATPEYFETLGSPLRSVNIRPDLHLVFQVDEAVHTTNLPEGLPAAYLMVDGQRIEPLDIEGLPEPDHHRATTVRFDRYLPDGTPLIKPTTTEMELFVSHLWADYGYEMQDRSMIWELPIVYPTELIENGRSVNFGTASVKFNFLAGLLPAILSPYFLLVQGVFLATILGLSFTEAGSKKPKILPAATSFLITFILTNTLFGALIGWLGNDLLDILITVIPTVSVLSGMAIVVLGLWIGIKADVPILNKIGSPKIQQNIDSGRSIAAGLMAVACSLGGMTAFSGGLATVLLIHLAAIGGAFTGALAMFVASVLLGIPLWLATCIVFRMELREKIGSVPMPVSSLALTAILVLAGVFIAIGSNPNYMEQIYLWLKIG